jgi:NADH:ubiquinone oxidoreductase subunit 4 (subunit M)
MMEGAAPEHGPVASALKQTGDRSGGKLADLRWQEWLALIPLIALIFYLGVVPATLTTRTEAATQQIVTATQQVAPTTIGATR